MNCICMRLIHKSRIYDLFNLFEFKYGREITRVTFGQELMNAGFLCCVSRNRGSTRTKFERFKWIKESKRRCWSGNRKRSMRSVKWPKALSAIELLDVSLLVRFFLLFLHLFLLLFLLFFLLFFLLVFLFLLLSFSSLPILFPLFLPLPPLSFLPLLFPPSPLILTIHSIPLLPSFPSFRTFRFIGIDI